MASFDRYCARLLRSGDRNGRIEAELKEGRNRQIRRMLEALNIECLRLVRVAFGNIMLGDLPKGAVRALTRGGDSRPSPASVHGKERTKCNEGGRNAAS